MRSQTLNFFHEAREARQQGVLDPEREDKMLLAYIQAFQAASRQFVKRQLTWFRSDPTVSVTNMMLLPHTRDCLLASCLHLCADG